MFKGLAGLTGVGCLFGGFRLFNSEIGGFKSAGSGRGGVSSADKCLGGATVRSVSVGLCGSGLVFNLKSVSRIK
jgi:hypothetical protein